MMESDFPEFDNAYKTVLVKDSTDKFEALAAKANFNIYHSDIWRGTARKFAESIVHECVRYFNEDYQRDFDTLWREDLSKRIKEHFGIDK